MGYLLNALAPNWRFILLGSVILNLSRVYMPALEALEADSLPKEHRGMGYSLISMAPSIFSALSPPIAGLIVSKYKLVPGMRILYLATTGIIALIALIRTMFLRETLIEKKSKTTQLTDPFSGLHRVTQYRIQRDDPRSLEVYSCGTNYKFLRHRCSSCICPYMSSKKHQ